MQVNKPYMDGMGHIWEPWEKHFESYSWELFTIGD